MFALMDYVCWDSRTAKGNLRVRTFFKCLEHVFRQPHLKTRKQVTSCEGSLPAALSTATNSLWRVKLSKVAMTKRLREKALSPQVRQTEGTTLFRIKVGETVVLVRNLKKPHVHDF